MVLAEEMLEFRCRDVRLSKLCEWCWSVKYAQVLGETHSQTASTDEQALYLICSWASWIKPYSRDQFKRRARPCRRTVES